MGALDARIPGTVTFLQPNPVLQISTGAAAITQGQFAYAISGINPDEVYATAGQFMQKMREFPGFLFVNSDLYNHTPNLQVEILRDQAKLYGVSETRILNLLHEAYSQNYIYLIKKPTNQYQVILEVADNGRSDPENLGLLYIKSDDGARMVPLSALATWHSVIGPQSVNHINQFTSVTVFFSLKPGYTIGQATDFVEKAAKQVLPPAIRGTLQGEALTFRNTVSSLTILMGLAVFVMYVMLAILYESYIHPLTVLSSLPVALVGGLFTLWLFGAEASLYAYIGMFMLMGIVKKNGIMIVDFAQQRVEHGVADDQAIHDASMERFRPIMMTTMAALMGALPIALGYGADGASRRPLGLVVIGGLIVSQFITLYITPAIYLYLEEFQEKVLDRVASSARGTCAIAFGERRGRERSGRLTLMTRHREKGRAALRPMVLACVGAACLGGCAVGLELSKAQHGRASLLSRVDAGGSGQDGFRFPGRSKMVGSFSRQGTAGPDSHGASEKL